MASKAVCDLSRKHTNEYIKPLHERASFTIHSIHVPRPYIRKPDLRLHTSMLSRAITLLSTLALLSSSTHVHALVPIIPPASCVSPSSLVCCLGLVVKEITTADPTLAAVLPPITGVSGAEGLDCSPLDTTTPTTWYVHTPGQLLWYSLRWRDCSLLITWRSMGIAACCEPLLTTGPIPVADITPPVGEFAYGSQEAYMRGMLMQVCSRTPRESAELRNCSHCGGDSPVARTTHYSAVAYELSICIEMYASKI